jgi:hypothetical protein
MTDANGKRRFFGRRELAAAVGLVVAVTAAALALVPIAMESGTPNGLHAYVLLTNPGPLRQCDPSSNCTAANTVNSFVYVANLNRLTNWIGYSTRATLDKAFVVSSIDSTVFVNGVHVPDFDSTLSPGPDASPKAWSGRWPSTVTCQGQPGSFQAPCDVVGNPSVIPGENAAVAYTSFAHGIGEPHGSYVFRYVVHGTFNGAPLDLTASSQPITMTG